MDASDRSKNEEMGAIKLARQYEKERDCARAERKEARANVTRLQKELMQESSRRRSGVRREEELAEERDEARAEVEALTEKLGEWSLDKASSTEKGSCPKCNGWVCPECVGKTVAHK